MRSLSLFLIVTAFIGLASTPTDDAKKDLEKFQGAWQATLVVGVDGAPAPESDVMATRLVVQGNQFTLKTKDGMVKGTFAIDPSRTPKAIEFTLEGQPASEKFLGIYRIDGDERRSCFAVPGKDRPTNLEPRVPGYLYFGWKRQAP
jgi:uncharacterized protein (TIGR03067 family)